MFHSCFIVSLSSIRICLIDIRFDVTLHRLDFPANVPVNFFILYA